MPLQAAAAASLFHLRPHTERHSSLSNIVSSPWLLVPVTPIF
jgi:hypothetical protein